MLLTWAGWAAFLICINKSLRALVTAVAADPRSCSKWSSLQAAWEDSTIPSTDLATNLAASISCSWHAGWPIVGATT